MSKLLACTIGKRQMGPLNGKGKGEGDQQTLGKRVLRVGWWFIPLPTEIKLVEGIYWGQ